MKKRYVILLCAAFLAIGLSLSFPLSMMQKTAMARELDSYILSASSRMVSTLSWQSAPWYRLDERRAEALDIIGAFETGFGTGLLPESQNPRLVEAFFEHLDTLCCSMLVDISLGNTVEREDPRLLLANEATFYLLNDLSKSERSCLDELFYRLTEGEHAAIFEEMKELCPTLEVPEWLAPDTIAWLAVERADLSLGASDPTWSQDGLRAVR